MLVNIDSFKPYYDFVRVALNSRMVFSDKREKKFCGLKIVSNGRKVLTF